MQALPISAIIRRFREGYGVSRYPKVDRVGRPDFRLAVVPCTVIVCYRE
jgi:hypothetical protein